jgi:mRNA interferase MazF
MARRMMRGEVWTYEFRSPDKLRPVVILSRTEAIPHLNAVLVAPITSTIRGIGSEVLLDERCGLKHVSSAKLDAIQCVDKSRVRRFVGIVPKEVQERLCDAVAFAIGCDDLIFH